MGARCPRAVRKLSDVTQLGNALIELKARMEKTDLDKALAKYLEELEALNEIQNKMRVDLSEFKRAMENLLLSAHSRARDALHKLKNFLCSSSRCNNRTEREKDTYHKATRRKLGYSHASN